MIKSDRWIRRMAQEHDMINPYSEKQVSAGVISYGVSSYGYDLRVADEFKIFTNVNSTIVDPKHFDECQRRSTPTKASARFSSSSRMRFARPAIRIVRESTRRKMELCCRSCKK